MDQTTASDAVRQDRNPAAPLNDARSPGWASAVLCPTASVRNGQASDHTTTRAHPMRRVDAHAARRATLLERTTLTAIINATKLVADRLEFLAGLDGVIFDPESKKKIKERKHLHRLLAENTWIFGEEFNLSVDDESLAMVLTKHLGLLERDELAPVTTLDGTAGIVDLMLSRGIPQSRPEQREHLVVELKRPSRKIDSDALQQIEKYAFAVAEDERFRDTPARWIFWVVSNDMDDYARRKVTKQADRPDGMLHHAEDIQLTIWVKTWGQILDESRGRLASFNSQLQYMVSHDTGLEYLRQTHAKYLEMIR